MNEPRTPEEVAAIITDLNREGGHLLKRDMPATGTRLLYAADVIGDLQRELTTLQQELAEARQELLDAKSEIGNRKQERNKAQQERDTLRQQLNVANSFIGSVAERLGLVPTAELPEITAYLNHTVTPKTTGCGRRWARFHL